MRNAKQSGVVKIKNGIVEADIANMSFDELPSDWQKENLNAGIAAVRIVFEGKEILSHEEMSAEVHKRWLSRQENSDINLTKSYYQLPEREKEKNRVHVDMAKAILIQEKLINVTNAYLLTRINNLNFNGFSK